jgi:hypothetical protein
MNVMEHARRRFRVQGDAALTLRVPPAATRATHCSPVLGCGMTPAFTTVDWILPPVWSVLMTQNP